MAHSEPDPTSADPLVSQPPAEADPLDPIAATEPTELPQKKPNWFVRFFGGTSKASAGPAGPTQQSGGTPAP